ncbi:hypothetical protein BDV38DRAFT_264360 [Aspergillus pseudotamarii]|uniref:Secreted protein n=1 Tax=Aspergillus pseudotamarii TaxID=132259 RepID=A0A5N6SDG0_ASPPS|nr:uncharacterized protein BDV38DRAFT_264360 [Aspergillus pseudotamarii]KAE8131433.1 hypothetical protein BDV38DRAFT_264360 [Aspergillus pseudotamarii]
MLNITLLLLLLFSPRFQVPLCPEFKSYFGLNPKAITTRNLQTPQARHNVNCPFSKLQKASIHVINVLIVI